MTDTSKVLIIDDEKNVLLSTQCFLEDEGYDVTTAASAEEALEFLKENEPDIALVDMRLPGMDGNDFIREASKKKAGLKYVVVTGSAHYAVPDELATLGVCEECVIKKPLTDMSVITQTIERLLKK